MSTNYEAVLMAANELGEDERLALIDALAETVRPNPDAPFSKEWQAEIARRVDEIKRGVAKTTPWSEVLERAEARLTNEQTR